MKAEHRKELETNALADRMGRALDNLKQKPQRGTVMYILFGAAVVVAVFLVVRYYRYGAVEGSRAWYEYSLGDEKSVLDTHGDQIQGKAVRFDRASEHLWKGVKEFASDPKGSRDRLRAVAKLYTDLREECKDDPVLEAEAMYGLAVVEETLAIDDRHKHLDRAVERYEDLVKSAKHKGTAYGQLAEKRLEALNDKERRQEISDVYQDLQNLAPRFDRKN